MSEKNENLQKGISLATTSVDDWLDKKKELDGAEGLWRIHDKLYDFTIWSRTHPGGKFLLDVSRGTDITEAFETHHLSYKPESLLQNYYKREAAIPRNVVSATFHENEFFKVFKRKVSQLQLATGDDTFLTVELLSDGLAAAVFLTGLMGATNGFMWTIASGVFLGLLSASSHAFFHIKDNWRIYYFNFSLMSSREWRIRHVLSHHQYRNTILDLEIPVWQSFFENYKKFSLRRLTLSLFSFFVFAHIQFLKRCLDVFLSKKLAFNSEELVAFLLPLFLYIFSGMQQWTAFVTWNLIVATGSFVFCFISSNFLVHEIQEKSENIKRRMGKDFGIVQLSQIQGLPKNNCSVLSFLNSFRGNILHYLNPTIRWKTLDKIVPVFEKTMDEFGISYEDSKRFLDGFQNGIPRGHIFFS